NDTVVLTVSSHARLVHVQLVLRGGQATTDHDGEVAPVLLAPAGQVEPLARPQHLDVCLLHGGRQAREVGRLRNRVVHLLLLMGAAVRPRLVGYFLGMSALRSWFAASAVGRFET